MEYYEKISKERNDVEPIKKKEEEEEKQGIITQPQAKELKDATQQQLKQ